MTFRNKLKQWLYGSCPGIAGAFPYFGVRVHFPAGSIIFEAACMQGIYESSNLRAMQAFARTGSCVLDVGANIGLMSVPLLATAPNVRVLSFEASPGTLRYLSRTRDESNFKDRWEIVAKAVGNTVGTTEFHVGASEMGAYDGIKSTGRAAVQSVVKIDATTIDVEWRKRGCPDVSVIKVDVEGAECEVILGAAECIAGFRPTIVVEWSPKNIGAYGRNLEDLFTVARRLGYRIWALPHLVEVCDPIALRVHASVTESYLLFAGTPG
jgi:FkbM family methyltransferase